MMQLTPSVKTIGALLVAAMIVVIVSIATSSIYDRVKAGAVPKVSAETGYRLLNIELSECIDHAIKTTVSLKMDVDTYTEIWRLCENQMYDQLLLNDFSIRRQKFEENALDERVNLWLVVVITLSGVVLAALQLVMSYRLSSTAKTELAGSNELAIEQGKLSLKSSVTGLLIMALSLVFFVVYVKWIYQNYDVVTQKPDNLKQPVTTARYLGTGALGWVGTPAKPPAAAPTTDPAAATDLAKPYAQPASPAVH